MEKSADLNIPELILRTWYQFFGLKKYLKFFDADADPG
jgi:hypothetical protein